MLNIQNFNIMLATWVVNMLLITTSRKALFLCAINRSFGVCLIFFVPQTVLWFTDLYCPKIIIYENLWLPEWLEQTCVQSTDTCVYIGYMRILALPMPMLSSTASTMEKLTQYSTFSRSCYWTHRLPQNKASTSLMVFCHNRVNVHIIEDKCPCKQWIYVNVNDGYMASHHHYGALQDYNSKLM